MIVAYRLGFMMFWLLLWALAARCAGGIVVSGPGATLKAAGRLIADGHLLRAAGESLTVYLGGHVIAVGFGLSLGILMGGFRVLGGLNKPHLKFTRDWVFATDDFKGAVPPGLEAWGDFSVIPQGRIVAVLEPSGCGKTTLFRLADGLIAPDTGSICVFGQPPRPSPDIGFSSR